MKCVFFGTPEFSAIILNRLLETGFIPAVVVTNPDRPAGRKKTITPPPVKFSIFNFQFSIKEKIKIFQPEKLDREFIQELKNLKPDFGILAAYGKIIPQAVINVFPKGIIVVHPSLLPKYRGATPIQSVILAGEKETGTTLILMDEKVDHGATISNFKIQISNDDTYETLSKKLADLSADLLVKTLPKYLTGGIKPQEQNHVQATYTKKFSSEDGRVDLEKNPPDEVWRKVRALNPEPGVYTIWQRGAPFDAGHSAELSRSPQGKRVKILEADLVDGKLILKKVQMEGGKAVLLTNGQAG